MQMDECRYRWTWMQIEMDVDANTDGWMQMHMDMMDGCRVCRQMNVDAD